MPIGNNTLAGDRLMCAPSWCARIGEQKPVPVVDGVLEQWWGGMEEEENEMVVFCDGEYDTLI